MFKQTRALLLLYMIILGSTSSNKCSTTRHMHLFRGYRCPDFGGNAIYSNFTPVHSHLCLYNCMMRKQCLNINENLPKGYCLLSQGLCMHLVPDSDFQVTFFIPSNTDHCLVWKQNRESSNPAMEQNTCSLNGLPCIVGRIHVQSHLLPGNFAGARLNTVLNMVKVDSPTCETLDVHLDCTVIWVPFDGGEPLPVPTVEGGYLYNVGVRQPLYIMSVVWNGCSVYGYYNPATGRGYTEHYYVAEHTHMNLMLLLG